MNQEKHHIGRFGSLLERGRQSALRDASGYGPARDHITDVAKGERNSEYSKMP